MTEENHNSAPKEEGPVNNVQTETETISKEDEEIEYAEFVDLPEEYREVAHQLKEENPRVFLGMNTSQKLEVIKTFGITSIKAMAHSGPLPDPESLARYNEIIPNGADRIMKMAENQQNHRMSVDKQLVKGNNNQITRGQWFGFLLALFFLGAGVYLTLLGHESVGKVIFGTTVIGLASIFVIGKLSKRKDD